MKFLSTFAKTLVFILLFNLLASTSIFADFVAYYERVYFSPQQAIWVTKNQLSGEEVGENAPTPKAHYIAYLNNDNVLNKYDYVVPISNPKVQFTCTIEYNKEKKLAGWKILDNKSQKPTEYGACTYAKGNISEITVKNHEDKDMHDVYHYEKGKLSNLEKMDSSDVVRMKILYWENGRVKEEGSFDHGKREGKWNYHNELGKLTKWEIYENNNLSGYRTYEYNEAGLKVRYDDYVMENSKKIHASYVKILYKNNKLDRYEKYDANDKRIGAYDENQQPIKE